MEYWVPSLSFSHLFFLLNLDIFYFCLLFLFKINEYPLGTERSHEILLRFPSFLLFLSTAILPNFASEIPLPLCCKFAATYSAPHFNFLLRSFTPLFMNFSVEKTDLHHKVIPPNPPKLLKKS